MRKMSFANRPGGNRRRLAIVQVLSGNKLIHRSLKFPPRGNLGENGGRRVVNRRAGNDRRGVHARLEFMASRRDGKFRVVEKLRKDEMRCRCFCDTGCCKFGDATGNR